MKKCEICGFETENGHIMSNHKRWKHLEISFSDEAKERMYKKKPRYTHKVFCRVCGKEGEVSTTSIEFNKAWYCSNYCAHSRVFSEDSKLKKSTAIKKYLERIGISILEPKICPVCGEKYKSKNKTCSYSCGAKLRHSLSLSEKKKYRLSCKFSFNLYDFPEEFNFSLIETYGWYKATNRGGNGSGISRDHKISVDYGWKNHIDPSIIRHPANCELMLHSENLKKNATCSISLEELMKLIKEWDYKYKLSW